MATATTPPHGVTLIKAGPPTAGGYAVADVNDADMLAAIRLSLGLPAAEQTIVVSSGIPMSKEASGGVTARLALAGCQSTLAPEPADDCIRVDDLCVLGKGLSRGGGKEGQGGWQTPKASEVCEL